MRQILAFHFFWRGFVIFTMYLVWIYRVSQKKIGILSSFEFLGLWGVFLGVKNNSKNFGNKKNIWLFSKILSKWTLYYSKSSDLLNLYDFVYFQMSKNHSKSYKICYLHTCMHKYWLLYKVSQSKWLFLLACHRD